MRWAALNRLDVGLPFAVFEALASLGVTNVAYMSRNRSEELRPASSRRGGSLELKTPAQKLNFTDHLQG